MAKRTFAVAALLALISVGSQPALAQPADYHIDGCAKLARIIYSEVANAALYGPGEGGPWMIEQGLGSDAQCTHVAKTVSRAFTAALGSAGYSTQFDNFHGDAGDACLSHYLSQCYPDRYPLTDGVGGYGLVLRLWSAVTQTVMRQMHNPYSSNQIQFRDSELRLRLGLALRTIKGRSLR